MADSTIVKTDQGGVNERILAREAKADFRRVEAASLKMRTYLTSAEAKRLFVRMFSTLQLNAHFISVIARTRLEHREVEAVEATLRQEIDAVKDTLGHAIDGAEALFQAHGISSFASYDTQPLEVEVGILSSSGRRYLEVLNQFDQLMPLLQTLEIHEVITTKTLDFQRATLKRQIRNIATSARRLATALRRRMNALTGGADGAAGPASNGGGPGRKPSVVDGAVPLGAMPGRRADMPVPEIATIEPLDDLGSTAEGAEMGGGAGHEELELEREDEGTQAVGTIHKEGMTATNRTAEEQRADGGGGRGDGEHSHRSDSSEG